MMEIDISSYVLPFTWNLMNRDEDDEASLEGSINMELTRERKRNDDEDGPEVKKIREGPSPVSDEELRGKLRYPDEGPSRWGRLRWTN